MLHPLGEDFTYREVGSAISARAPEGTGDYIQAIGNSTNLHFDE